MKDLPRKPSCPLSRWDLLKATLENLPFSEFEERRKNCENAVTLDVRTLEEHEIYALEGSTHLDYLAEDLADRLESLDQEKTYFVYCATGRRSARVCVILRNLGFKKLYHLKNGL